MKILLERQTHSLIQSSQPQDEFFSKVVRTQDRQSSIESIYKQIKTNNCGNYNFNKWGVKISNPRKKTKHSSHILITGRGWGHTPPPILGRKKRLGENVR